MESDAPYDEHYTEIYRERGYEEAATYLLNNEPDEGYAAVPKVMQRFSELPEEEREAITKMQRSRNRAWMRGEMSGQDSYSICFCGDEGDFENGDGIVFLGSME